MSIGVYSAGQSNACGLEPLPSGYTSDWILPDGSILSDSNLHPETPIIRHGVEFALSQCRYFSNVGDVHFDLYCLAGKAIDQFDSTVMVDGVVNIGGGNLNEVVMIWNQGESDAAALNGTAATSADSDAYQVQEQALFSAVISARPDVKIISVLLVDTASGILSRASFINDAKIANAALFPDNVTIVEHEGPFMDDLHYEFDSLAGNICTLLTESRLLEADCNSANVSRNALLGMRMVIDLEERKAGLLECKKLLKSSQIPNEEDAASLQPVSSALGATELIEELGVSVRDIRAALAPVKHEVIRN